MRYILALDQGTTSSRAVAFDETGRMVGSHGIEFPQHYPHPGWVEHDPKDILDSQIRSLKLTVELCGIDPKDIAAVGITNQRETTLLWEPRTGEPVCNAIVWQCRRTAPCGTAEEGRPGQRHHQPHGPDSRRVFFRHEAGMDAGKHPRGPGNGRKRVNCASARWTAISPSCSPAKSSTSPT